LDERRNDGATGVSSDGSRPAQLVPVRVRHDEEQVLGVGADVGLPHVLEVVVVVRRSHALDLREDSAPRGETIEEVGACVGDQAVLGREHDFLAEAKSGPEQVGHDGLDRPALRAVHVHGVDGRFRRLEVVKQVLSKAVDDDHLGIVIGYVVAHEARVADRPHGAQLRSCEVEKLVEMGGRDQAR
jgi:hypothetical protein